MKELQHLLAERFLTSDNLNFQRDAELNEMFKSRFEQIHIQQCEIMLRDVVESKKVDNDIHHGLLKPDSDERKRIQAYAALVKDRFGAGSEKYEQFKSILRSRDQQLGVQRKRLASLFKDEPDLMERFNQLRKEQARVLQVKVLSRVYWPPLKDEAFQFPPAMRDIAERHANLWKATRRGRRLEWLKALGHVTLKLELQDRTINEKVTTLQAAVIHDFNDPKETQGIHSDPVTRTVQQITANLQVDESLARAALMFWVGKLVLRESPTVPNAFTVMETLHNPFTSSSEDMDKAAAAAQQADTAAASSGLKSEADVVKENFDLYARFVEGMLTNQGAMSASRIKVMLNMLVPGGFPFEETDLVGLLDEMAEGKKIERAGALWRIARQ